MTEIQDPPVQTPKFTPDGHEMKWTFLLDGYEPVECDGRPQRVRPSKAEVRFYDYTIGPSWEIYVAGRPVTAKDEDAQKRHPCAIKNHRFKQNLLVDLIGYIKENAADLPDAPPRPLDTEEDMALRGLQIIYGNDPQTWDAEVYELAKERGLLREKEA